MKTITPNSQSGFALLSIKGLALIVFLLLVTGAGQWMWRNTLQLGMYCHEVSGELNIQQYTMDACNWVGQNIASMRNHLEQQVSFSKFGDTMNLEQFSAKMARSFSEQTLGFNAPQLSGLTDGNLLRTGNFDMNNAAPLDKLRMALTQGSVGNDMLRSGNPAGQEWLKSSANMGEFGVLSQLSLGSAYMNGAKGIAPDTRQAYQYNRMALDSITKLKASNSPESKRLLGSLPASPDAMTRSLTSALEQSGY